MAHVGFEPGNPYGGGQSATPKLRWGSIVACVLLLLVLSGLWILPRKHGPAAVVRPIPPATQDVGSAWAPHIQNIRYEPEIAQVEPDEKAQAIMALQAQLDQLEKSRAIDQERMQQQVQNLQHALEDERGRKAAIPGEAGHQVQKKRKHQSMLFEEFKVDESILKKKNEYILAPWSTKVLCTTETVIHSELESILTAKVSVGIYDSATGKHLLIPQGSTIGGRYLSKDLLFGNERNNTVALEISLPNGSTIPLGEVPILDQVGSAGLSGEVNHHWGRLFGAVFINGVLRGGAETVRTGTQGSGVAGTAASSMAAGAAQTGGSVTRPMLDTRPTIITPASQLCTIILTKPLVLEAYNE